MNLLALLLLLEIGSVGAYFLKTHEFFYTRDRNRVRVTRDDYQNEDIHTISNTSTTDFQLHPYFGFVERAGKQGSVNNFGFQSPYDLPFRKTDSDQFIVGVLGGSVAEGYAQTEITYSILARAIHNVPGLQKRSLVVLNLALPASKEPQQLLVLNYLLSLGQEFDAVINIDGFNEVAISEMNRQAGIDVSMPAAFMILPLIELADKNPTTEGLALIVATMQAKRQLIGALDLMSRCRLAMCYTASWIEALYWRRQYAKMSQELAERKAREPALGSLVWLRGADQGKENQQFEEAAADVWMNSSRALRDLLTARGVPYFQFLQPNQYYPTGRQFGAAERKIAFTDQSMLRVGAITGYPLLLSRLDSLQRSGVRIFNAVNIFDQVKEPVYRDTCCHYNADGDRIFAEFVAQHVVLELKSEPTTK